LFVGAQAKHLVRSFYTHDSSLVDTKAALAGNGTRRPYRGRLVRQEAVVARVGLFTHAERVTVIGLGCMIN
jgi:hypothetical protein